MRPQRRALLQGILACGAIASVGLPRLSLARSPAPPACRVVLASCGGSDTGFATAAADLVAARHRLGAGPLPDPAACRRLFDTCRGMRLIGLMEDAAYRVFAELARDSGVRLVCEGQHVCSADGRLSRHIFNAAIGFHGASEDLAAALTRADAAFAIAEAPLGSAGRRLRGGDWSPLGFTSFHVASSSPLWLHLAGLPPQAACEALGVPVCRAEPLRHWPIYRPPACAASWQAALGGALASLAAGGGKNRRPAVHQIFVRDAAALEDFLANSFVSFVMEA